MELFNFFDKIEISADGKRMVGRRLRRDHTQATTATEAPKEVIVASVPHDDALKSFMIDVTKKNIENYQSQADEVDQELNSIVHDIDYYTDQIKRLRQKQKWWKNATPYYTIGCGILGFVLGLAYSVYAFLSTVGATFTVISTVGATLLYLIAGITFALLFALSGHLHSFLMSDCHRKRIENAAEILKRLSASKKAFLEKRSQLAELISKERQRNWHYREL